MFISIKTKLHEYFRVKRLKAFAKIYPNLPDLTVLDVGGTPVIWNLLKKNYGLKPKKVVLLNSNPVHLSKKENSNHKSSENDYETVLGDGCNLPFTDNSFDLVFSNSVIEHVGNQENKEQFAQECQRVGEKIYIQTPNRWFPLEPHILAFFIHWLPRNLYRKLYFLSFIYLYQVYCDLYKGNRGSFNARGWLENAELLSYKELQKIFPDHQIDSEKFLWLTKSFIVTR